jgi:hypothetical protein
MRPLRAAGRVLMLLSFLSALLWTQGCIPPKLLGPPSQPYTADEMKAILKEAISQEDLVKTLFCTGTLTSGQGETEQEANISIVGQRNPFRVKIEITHPWGSDIANLLLDESRFTLVLFPEKRVLVGSVRKGMLKRSFPVPFDPSAVWAFVRGYPSFPEYKRAASPKKGIISLLDERDATVRQLDFNLSTLKPKTCYFPAIRVTQYYEAFEKRDSIEFARTVVLKEGSQETTLTLRIKHALFNPHLPSGIFQVKKPAKFTTVDLSRQAPTH